MHKERLTDRYLERLAGWELLTSISNTIPPKYKLYMDFVAYPEAQYRWIKQIKNGNAEIKKVLDGYFDALYKYVFSESDELKI